MRLICVHLSLASTEKRLKEDYLVLQSVRANLPRSILLLAWVFFLLIGLWPSKLLPSMLLPLSGTWGKMASSIALVVLSMLARFQVDTSSKRYARWICVGMILGTLGDFFNADLLGAITSQGTLAAIVAFGLGHLCYIGAIVGELRRCEPIRGKPIWFAITVWQFVGLLSWYFIVYHGEKAREIVWPALGYTLLLSGTAGLATALAVYRRHTWPLAIGAALFLLSDLLLAVGMFRGSYPFRSELVWMTYGPGQMLIVFSAWLVARRLDIV